jgi:hypothetical protein
MCSRACSTNMPCSPANSAPCAATRSSASSVWEMAPRSLRICARTDTGPYQPRCRTRCSSAHAFAAASSIPTHSQCSPKTGATMRKCCCCKCAQWSLFFSPVHLNSLERIPGHRETRLRELGRCCRPCRHQGTLACLVQTRALMTRARRQASAKCTTSPATCKAR